MRNLITAAAMVLFLLTVMGWQTELQGALHQKQRLQYAAQEAAAVIALDAAAAPASGDLPAVDWEQARRTAEACLQAQLAGGAASGEPVTAEAAFDRRGSCGRLGVAVTARQGDVTASGWYPVPMPAEGEGS